MVACPQFLALGPVNLARFGIIFSALSWNRNHSFSKCNIPLLIFIHLYSILFPGEWHERHEAKQTVFAVPLYKRCWEQCARCIISSTAAWQTVPAFRLWAPHLCIAPESWTEWTLIATSHNRHDHTLLIHLTFELHLSCCMWVLMCFARCETVTCWDLTFDSFPSQKSTESLTRLKPQTGRCTEMYELYYGILLDYPLTNKPPSSSRFRAEMAKIAKMILEHKLSNVALRL